ADPRAHDSENAPRHRLAEPPAGSPRASYAEPAASTHRGPSFLGLFTSLLTRWAVIHSSGSGTSIAFRASARCSFGSSHRSKLDGSRMTGIRSCTGPTTPLASVVISVHDSTGSSPFS